MHTVSQQASSPSESHRSLILADPLQTETGAFSAKSMRIILLKKKKKGTSFLVLAVTLPADGKQSTWAAPEITVICEQTTAAGLFTSAL